MPRLPKQPPSDTRARREFVDTATGAPVHPAPADRRESDGSAPTGRVVAEVDGVEVPLAPGEVLSQEGSHPRDQRFDYDPTDVAPRAREAVREASRRSRPPAKPRELRETFDSPSTAAKAFYDENELFFDGVRDPHDGLRDWLVDRTTPRDRERILALRGAPAIRAALALVFGRARGKRWDAVSWHDVDALAEALEPYYEQPEEGGQPGLYWRPAFGGLTVEQLEALPPAKRKQAVEWESHEEIRDGVAEAREIYEHRRSCMTPGARVVIERRLVELERWRDDPSRIPGFACEPDERTGGYTCNYPAVSGEIAAIRDACNDEGYDPDWSTPASRAGDPGFPDTSRGPADPRLQQRARDRGDPCLRTEHGMRLGEAAFAVVEERTIDGVLYRLERSRCGQKPRPPSSRHPKGRRGCHCYSNFPQSGHGPYWRAYLPDTRGGYCRAIYIGKEFRTLTAEEKRR